MLLVIQKIAAALAEQLRRLARPVPFPNGLVPDRLLGHSSQAAFSLNIELRYQTVWCCCFHIPGLQTARRSAAGDDLHNLQPVARVELAAGKLGWGHGFA